MIRELRRTGRWCFVVPDPRPFCVVEAPVPAQATLPQVVTVTLLEDRERYPVIRLEGLGLTAPAIAVAEELFTAERLLQLLHRHGLTRDQVAIERLLESL